MRAQIIAFLLCVVALGACEGEEPEGLGAPAATFIPFAITEVQDISYGPNRRLMYRISPDAAISAGQALEIAEFLVEANHRREDPVNAVAFAFHLPGHDGTGVPSFMIDWAPDGDWSKADTVIAGEYATFAFTVTDNSDLVETLKASPIGSTTPTTESTVPVEDYGYCFAVNDIAFKGQRAAQELLAHQARLQNSPAVANDPAWVNDGWAVGLAFKAAARAIRDVEATAEPVREVHGRFLELADRLESIAATYPAAVDDEDVGAMLAVLAELDAGSRLLDSISIELRGICSGG